MKIRLYAFGDELMGRKLIDVPENTTPKWTMVLTQPITAIIGYSGEKIGEHQPFNTVCEFEWTGKYEAESGARVYQLVNITKI